MSRPIYICVSHYADELEAGAMLVSEVVQKACLLGADGVELRPELWPDYARELAGTRQLAASLDLDLTYATRNPLFAADAEGQRGLLHDVDTAVALGSPLLRVFPGQTPPDGDPGWAAAEEAVAYAAARGIVLALENYVGMPGGTLAEIVRVLERIPSPALGTNIDIGNYVVRGQDVLEAIRTVGQRAVYAHLKDKPEGAEGPYTYLGGGAMALPPILDALDGLPQEMAYCFEFPGGGEPDERIRRSLAYLRERQE